MSPKSVDVSWVKLPGLAYWNSAPLTVKIWVRSTPMAVTVSAVPSGNVRLSLTP